MRHYQVRIKGRLLQALYRPKVRRYLPTRVLQVFEEIDNSIEEKITPLLSDLF